MGRFFLDKEQMWDMPIGGISKEKHIPHWFGNAAYVVVGGLCKLLFRYRVDGRESLRAFNKKSGVLLVCNHTSYLDVVFVYLGARLKQWARLIGKEQLFDMAGGLLGNLLSRVGAFPIKRGTSDRKALRRASRNLKNCECVMIFPEGTRRGKSGVDPKLHAGAAFIAKMGHAPILPMTVRNAELVKQKGKFIRFPKITVEYGNPILFSDFNDLPKDERYEGCTWYAMRECFALFYSIPAEEVDMVGLFPESKDYSEYFAQHPRPAHTSQEVVADIEAKAAEKAAKEAAKAKAEAEAKAAAKAADSSVSGEAE